MPWCLLRPCSVSSDAFTQFTSHLSGINPEELKHRPWSIPAEGGEARKGGGPAEKHSVIGYKRKKKKKDAGTAYTAFPHES